MIESDDVLREAVRFAEEYGYNRWQEARDEHTRLQEIERAARATLDQFPYVLPVLEPLRSELSK